MALKNVLTLGIHTKVWLFRVNREMDGHEGFHLNLRALGFMVAFPIVTPIIVKFQTARRLNQMTAHHLTIPRLRSSWLGWLSIVPVLGSGFYAYWMQDSLNRHWFWHRREERMRLAGDRIARIDAQPATEALAAKRAEMETDIVTWKKEIQDEIVAARVRYGEIAFGEREKRAAAHAAQGRLSRTELARLRADEKANRKAAREGRAGKRRRLLPGKKAGREAAPDPDDDAQWQPATPLPPRLPDAIRELALAEKRDLSPEEEKQIKAAEKILAKREKEAVALDRRRAKLRAGREKDQEKAEKAEAAKRLAAERAEAAAQAQAAKAAKKAAKKAVKEPAPPAAASAGDETLALDEEQVEPEEAGIEIEVEPRPAAPARAAAPPSPRPREEEIDLTEEEPIPVVSRPRKPAPAATVPSAAPRPAAAPEGPLRILTLTCPRCKARIEGVKKRGDAPAKLTCPSCGLVGKV